MIVPFFYMSLLVTVGTLFHTFSAKDWGGYGEMASHANLHIHVDFVFLMLMGVMIYVFPSWVAKMVVSTVCRNHACKK